MKHVENYLFTSESVTEGHPDKVADQISDAVLDAMLEQDPLSRVACEVLLTTGLAVVSIERRSTAIVDIEAIVRRVAREIGYTSADIGFDADNCEVRIVDDPQSADIAQGVDSALESRGVNASVDGLETGAGDQGMMFGFACNETEQRMPLPITLAHAVTRQLARVRKDHTVPYLLPDGKAQVTVEYVDGEPVGVKTVVVSTQHRAEWNGAHVDRNLVIEPDIRKHVLAPALGGWLTDDTQIYINPTGQFVTGGPNADTGLTGRKIIVDTYGGAARHGGGAFSGKDATKVDRSACYAARWVARNVVAAGLAGRCEIQIAYAIGKASPVSFYVDTFGTETVDANIIEQAIGSVFDLRPDAIIRDLELRRPIFQATASYGHFGRDDIDAPWERENRVDEIRQTVDELTGNGARTASAQPVGA